MIICKQHSTRGQNDFLPWDATGLRVAVLASKAKLNGVEQQTRPLHTKNWSFPTWEADAGCSQFSWPRSPPRCRQMANQTWRAGTGRHLQRTDTISHLDIKPKLHQAGVFQCPRQTYADYTPTTRWVAGTARWLQPSDPISHSQKVSPAAISAGGTVLNSRALQRYETPRLMRSEPRPALRKRQLDSHGNCSSRSQTRHSDIATSDRRTRSCSSGSAGASFASGDRKKTAHQLTPSLTSRSRA